MKAGDVVEYKKSKWTILGFVIPSKELIIEQFYVDFDGVWQHHTEWGIPKHDVKIIGK